MKIRKEHIGALIAFLAGFILTAHEIIPHHHHFDTFFDHVGQQSECQTGNPEQDHPEDPDRHCHAFNDLIVDWVKHYKIAVKPLIASTDQMFAETPEVDLQQNTFSRFFAIYCNIPAPLYFVFHEVPLRAPPVMI